MELELRKEVNKMVIVDEFANAHKTKYLEDTTVRHPDPLLVNYSLPLLLRVPLAESLSAASGIILSAKIMLYLFPGWLKNI